MLCNNIKKLLVRHPQTTDHLYYNLLYYKIIKSIGTHESRIGMRRVESVGAFNSYTSYI